MAAMLTGCLAQSSIQADYMDAQDTCRDKAENAVSSMPDDNELNARQRNAALVGQFADCMNRNGWHVSRPAGAPPVAATTIVTQPSGAVTVATPPATAAVVATPARPVTVAPATPSVVTVQPAQVPVHTDSTPLQPGRSSPPLDTPDNSAASYQPSATGDGSDASNAGRHF